MCVCVFVYHKTIRPKPLQLGVQIIHVSKCYTDLVAAPLLHVPTRVDARLSNVCVVHQRYKPAFC